MSEQQTVQEPVSAVAVGEEARKNVGKSRGKKGERPKGKAKTQREGEGPRETDKENSAEGANKQKRGGKKEEGEKSVENEAGEKQPGKEEPRKRKHQQDFLKVGDTVYSWKREEITLESKVPEMPTENLKEPDRNQMINKMKNINGKIDIIIQNTMKKIEELKLTKQNQAVDTESRLEDMEECREEKLALKEELKEKNEVLNSIKQKFEEQRTKVQHYVGQIDEIRKKIPNQSVHNDAMTKQLQQLQHRKNNELISSNEEKNINKQIEQIKKAMPLMDSINEIMDKKREEDQKLRLIKKDLNVAFSERNKVGDAYSKRVEQFKEFLELKKRGFIQIGPEVKALKIKANEQIEVYENEIQAVKKQFKKDNDLYYQNLRIQSYIKWISGCQKYLQEKAARQQKRIDWENRQNERKQRQQQRLQRQADDQKREIERELMREIEDSEYRPEFLDRIEMADILVSYLENQLPQKQKQVQESQQEHDLSQVKQVVEQDQLTLVERKPRKEDFAVDTKTRKSKQHVQSEREDKAHLLSIHVLNGLNQFGIRQPSNSAEIETAIATIRQKQEEFRLLETKAREDFELQMEEKKRQVNKMIEEKKQELDQKLKQSPKEASPAQETAPVQQE